MRRKPGDSPHKEPMTMILYLTFLEKQSLSRCSPVSNWSPYQAFPPIKLVFYEMWIAHYNDIILGVIASQITSLTIVFSTVYSGADRRKHQSSASLAFVQGIHRGPVNSPHKWPVTRKMFPFDDVIVVLISFHFIIAGQRISSWLWSTG